MSPQHPLQKVRWQDLCQANAAARSFFPRHAKLAHRKSDGDQAAKKGNKTDLVRAAVQH